MVHGGCEFSTSVFWDGKWEGFDRDREYMIRLERNRQPEVAGLTGRRDIIIEEKPG
jgi:hypothetical protein